VEIDGQPVLSLPVSELDAGQATSFNYEYVNVPATPKPHVVEVCADPDNDIEESDETNNCKSLEVVPVGKPDLIVASLSAAPKTVTAGGKVTVRFTVKNQGESLAGATTAGLYLNGVYVQSFAVDALEAGETSPEAKCMITVPASPLNQEVLVRVDESNVVDESDESNNEKKAEVQVKAPDVLGVSLTAAQVGKQQKVSVTTTVKNNGKATTGCSFKVRIQICKKSGGKEEVVKTDVVTAKLDAGKTTTPPLTKVIDIPKSVKAGKLYARVIGDETDVVKESNENNNTKEISFTYKK